MLLRVDESCVIQAVHARSPNNQTLLFRVVFRGFQRPLRDEIILDYRVQVQTTHFIDDYKRLGVKMVELR